MRFGLVVAVFGLVGLAGCSGAAPVVSSVGPPISPLSDVALTGVVSSGAQPIVGAHVYLLAANTTGYGGNGIAASSSNASFSLMAAQETKTADSVGAYVTTDANGKFSLTGDYSCSSGQQLYLYALGGNAGSGVNSAAGSMAVVGSCPSSSGPAVFATVNEVSTIAAAYALAGFATDATHVGSSGTALAQVGVANAFANAANLETLGTGAALAATPAGNGKVPQAEINTLANILASCVSASSSCSTLFANALASGATGAVPTDTATAAINIAHNPGVGIAALYGLAGSVFSPKLSAQPNDWTIGVTFAGNGLASPDNMALDASGDVWVSNEYPIDVVTELSSMGVVLAMFPVPGGGMAIDNSGDVWVTNLLGKSVTELSSSGAVLSGTSGYTGGGLNGPAEVAIDGLGNAWVSNNEGVIELSDKGVVLSGASGYASTVQPGFIAIDGSGNAWTSASGVGEVVEVSSSGSIVSGASGYSIVPGPEGISIDASGDAWVAGDSGQNNVGELSNSGAILSGASGYTGGGLNRSIATVVDGAGSVWVTNGSGNTISELSHSGVALSGASGYGAPSSGPFRVAVDGSGDLWVVNDFVATLTELLGAGTPVITPIAAGLPATPTANGSSNLGTRP